MQRLLESILAGRRNRKLKLLQQDFTAIVGRLRKERDAKTVTTVAERLEEKLNRISQRLERRPADRATLMYDLSQENRAARNRNDQVEFTAITLTIITLRARRLNEDGHAGSGASVRSGNEMRTESSGGSVENQCAAFLRSPVIAVDDGDEP